MEFSPLTPLSKTAKILTKSREELMTDKTFDPNEFIEQSTDIVQRIKEYTENNTPSPELVDAMKELHSDLLNYQSKLDEVIVKNDVL